MTNASAIRPVIMSGGAGTRLWPLSRREAPKQFHRFTGEETLFQETVKRVVGEGFSAPVVLSAELHTEQIARELDAIGVGAEAYVVEPVARNTAPAIAALSVARARSAPEEIVVVLPADHAIADAAAFRAYLLKGRAQAEAGRIVTFGVRPSTPETGYGYVRVGESLNEDASLIQQFKEKPDRKTAEAYLASGEYYWNAGVFMFRAETMIAEMRKHCPDILETVQKSVEAGETKSNALILDKTHFGAARQESIDYAVMEHTDRAAIVPMSIGWSDVGSWSAVGDLSVKDEAGNSDLAGGAILLDCENTLTVGEGGKIAAIGVRDVVIVAHEGAVLVVHKDRAQDV